MNRFLWRNFYEASIQFINLIISMMVQVFLDYFISFNNGNFASSTIFQFEILMIIWKSFHEYFTISKVTITVIWKRMARECCFDLFWSNFKPGSYVIWLKVRLIWWKNAATKDSIISRTMNLKIVWWCEWNDNFHRKRKKWTTISTITHTTNSLYQINSNMEI